MLKQSGEELSPSFCVFNGFLIPNEAKCISGSFPIFVQEESLICPGHTQDFSRTSPGNIYGGDIR